MSTKGTKRNTGAKAKPKDTVGTITREEAKELFTSITMLLNVTDNKSEYNDVLIRNKHLLKAEVEAGDERMQAIEKAKRELAMHHCEKGEDGKPLMHKDEEGRMIMDGLLEGFAPEYDKALAKLIEQQKAIAAEPIEFKRVTLHKKLLPAKLNGLLQDGIRLLMG